MIFFVVDMCYLLAFSNEYFIFLSHSEALLLFFLSDDAQIRISMVFSRHIYFEYIFPPLNALFFQISVGRYISHIDHLVC